MKGAHGEIMWKLDGDFKFDDEFKKGVSKILEQKTQFQLMGVLVYKHNDKNFRETVSSQETWIELHNSSGEHFLVFCFQDESIEKKNKASSFSHDSQTFGYMSAINAIDLRGPKGTYDRLLSILSNEQLDWDHSPLLLLCPTSDQESIAITLPQEFTVKEYKVFLPKLMLEINNYLSMHSGANLDDLVANIRKQFEAWKLESIMKAWLPSGKKIIEYFKKQFLK